MRRMIVRVCGVTVLSLAAGGVAFLSRPRLACGEASPERMAIPVKKDQTQFEHVYTLRNRSIRTIRLDGIKRSCNCLKVEVPDPVIPPLASRDITARFDVARNAAGVRNADFLVFANGRREPLLRLQMAYSFELGVWAYPERIELGRVVGGRPVEFEILIRQAKAGGGNAEFFSRGDVKTRRGEAGQSAEGAAGSRIHISGVEGKGMTFEVQDARDNDTLTEQKILGRFVNQTGVGYHERAVAIKTDHPEYPELTVPVRWESVPEWSFTPSALHFGVLTAGDKATRTVTLVSESGKLTVRRAEVSGDGFRLESQEQIAPDKVAFMIASEAGTAQGLHHGKLTAILENDGEAQAALVFVTE